MPSFRVICSKRPNVLSERKINVNDSIFVVYLSAGFFCFCFISVPMLYRFFCVSLSCHLIHVFREFCVCVFFRSAVIYSLFYFFFDRDQNICHSTAKECWRNERIFYVYKYIGCVSTLFGVHISKRPILVRIEFSNIDAFRVWLQNCRPLHRLNANMLKHQHAFDFDYGLLYHDACSLKFNMDPAIASQTGYDNVMAIEIKPKQGWNICTLPEWLLEMFGISHGLRDRCRFCAMQYFKVI